MADITQIKVGSTTYDIKDTSKLPKFTNEWRKEYNAGGTVGYMLIGSFPMYDSNVTIDIDSTTTTTYHGTVIIATQNVSTTSMGSAHTITVYGDPTGTISNAITVTWKSGSRNYNVYFSPFTWSKNFISARGIGQYMGEIDTSTMFTFTTGTAPATTSGLTVVNALTSSFAPKSHNHAASNITSGTLSSNRLPTVPVAKGGTGATTAAGALTNLGITATAAELNKLDGVTATTTELNHVDGVTSNIQTQLNNKAGVTHNQASNTINAMTGYSKPSSTSAIAATDTLNAAIGKLEKAIDGKTSNTGTVTSVGTGVGLTGGTITGAGTVKAKLRSETALTVDSAAATTTSGRVYPVAVDKSGYLSVNVPWTDNNTVYTHPNSGVTAGTYKSVTVNATGHVTGGSNPTTLSGYGITDAAPLSHTTTTSNPHSVTKSQVGLGNVVNTGDSATPTSGGTTKFTTGGAYTELAKKAPTSHASTATTYGIGTSSNYGHVKLSDSTSSTSAASAGIAASPKAVKAAYDLAASKAGTSVASTTANGLMSKEDKAKLDGINIVASETPVSDGQESPYPNGTLYLVLGDVSSGSSTPYVKVSLSHIRDGIITMYSVPVMTGSYPETDPEYELYYFEPGTRVEFGISEEYVESCSLECTLESDDSSVSINEEGYLTRSIEMPSGNVMLRVIL